MDLFTYVQFGIVWTGQDSARRSGYFLVVRNRLVQLVWSRIRLVCQELLHGQLLETVCKPQLNETFRNSPEGPWVNFACTVEMYEQGKPTVYEPGTD